LKSECQHFLDCIREGISPLTNGKRGTELVRILEASSLSLKQNGAPVQLPSGLPRSIAPHLNGVSSLPIDKNSSGAERQESILRA
jgi:hypothetical protein